MSTTLTILAAHMVGEYILQTDWMAAHKLTDWRARLAHVAIYTACFSVVALQVRMPATRAGVFLLAIGVPHFIVDCRRWASGEHWPPKPIMVDQAIHMTCLAIVAAVFGL